MRRTRVTTIVVLVVLGAVGGWFVDTALVSAGQRIIAIPATLPPVLVAIGGIVVLLAIPIRRMTRGTSRRRVDHMYSTRVVVLAKASALTGALIAGVAIGICGYLLTRAVMPTAGTFGLAIATLVAAAILLAAGLVAEWFCTIPPEDGDDENGPGKQPAGSNP